jgi:uncharacterized protein (DUF2141 family)
MIRLILTALLLTCIQTFPLYSQPQPGKGTLEITFTGLRNDVGLVAIGINKSEKGWPRKPDMDPNWKKTNGKASTMTVKLENFPYGTYAISMLDDENKNLDMDSFLGIPKEGFGFSNNPKVGFSAPDFEECTFVFNQPVQRIRIEVRYMGKGN